MTTDLTGGSHLDEEAYDWDVFAPDPDEAEIVAASAALEDHDELNLDDSHLDWEAALQEPETLGEAEGEARAGAAFDRIVDTVRRSVEEPEAETEDADEIVAVREAEAVAATGLSWPDLHDGLDPDHQPEPDAVYEARIEPVHEAAAPVVAFEPRAEPDEHGRQVEEMDVAPWAAPDLSQEGTWEPRPEPEPHPVPIFEPEAAPVAAVQAAPTWGTSSESEPETAQAPAPVNRPGDDAAEVPTKGRSRKDGKRRPRSRVFTATVVLAVLFLMVVGAVVAVRSINRHSTANAPSAAAHTHSTSRVSPPPDAARMQSATDAVDSATTAAQVGLTSLSNFPTPSNVAKVIYPYISSLQLYQSFLASSTVPVPARAAAASAASQIRQELTFLDTVSALPPEQLGAYLDQFGTDATRLQTTLSALEQELRTPRP